MLDDRVQAEEGVKAEEAASLYKEILLLRNFPRTYRAISQRPWPPPNTSPQTSDVTFWVRKSPLGSELLWGSDPKVTF